MMAAGSFETPGITHAATLLRTTLTKPLSELQTFHPCEVFEKVT
jgi:hypothetical protein